MSARGASEIAREAIALLDQLVTRADQLQRDPLRANGLVGGVGCLRELARDARGTLAPLVAVGERMPEADADREMRLGILNAFQRFMRDVDEVADNCQHDTSAVLLRSAKQAAMVSLTTVLLSHPMNGGKGG